MEIRQNELNFSIRPQFRSYLLTYQLPREGFLQQLRIAFLKIRTLIVRVMLLFAKFGLYSGRQSKILSKVFDDLPVRPNMESRTERHLKGTSSFVAKEAPTSTLKKTSVIY